jgi:hypothetical protein
MSFKNEIEIGKDLLQIYSTTWDEF